MLTSPIKPPLPSASPSPALSFCSFFPLRHLNLSAASRETSGSLTPPPSPCFLPRQPCGHSIVCRSANTACISCTCVHYQKIRKEPRHRLPAVTPAGTPYVTILTFYEGGSHKPVPPRSSVLIRIFILSDRSRVKSYANVWYEQFQSIITATTPRLSNRKNKSVNRNALWFNDLQMLTSMY